MKYLLVSVFLLFAFLDAALGCMCMDQHVQLTYCKNPIAAKVIVLEKQILRQNLYHDENTGLDYFDERDARVEIKVRVISLYKGDESKTIDKIYTMNNDGLCGVGENIKVGHYYMLTATYRGDQVWIGTCTFLYDITHSTFLESKLLSENFQRNWGKGCGCDFERGGKRSDPSTTFGRCAWDEKDNYDQNFSYCFPDKNQVCRGWKYNVALLKSRSSGKKKYKKSRASFE